MSKDWLGRESKKSKAYSSSKVAKPPKAPANKGAGRKSGK